MFSKILLFVSLLLVSLPENASAAIPCQKFLLSTTTGNLTLGYAELTLLSPDNTYTINKYDPTTILASQFQLDAEDRLFRLTNFTNKYASFPSLPYELQFRTSMPAGVKFPKWKYAPEGNIRPHVGKGKGKPLALYACGIIQLTKEKRGLPPVEPIVSIAAKVPTSCYTISLTPTCPPSSTAVPLV